MNEKPRVKCPNCGGLKTQIAFLSTPMTYIRGYGYMDKEGRRRDMNLFKLQNDDPYKKYRAPGEKDDLAHRLRRGGKHNPKRKTYLMNRKSK
jgi:rRNA maturation protein Nop10